MSVFFGQTTPLFLVISLAKSSLATGKCHPQVINECSSDPLATEVSKGDGTVIFALGRHMGNGGFPGSIIEPVEEDW